eukprot:1193615-Prorocentrum_minimum.AAC.1
MRVGVPARIITPTSPRPPYILSGGGVRNSGKTARGVHARGVPSWSRDGECATVRGELAGVGQQPAAGDGACTVLPGGGAPRHPQSGARGHRIVRGHRRATRILPAVGGGLLGGLLPGPTR